MPFHLAQFNIARCRAPLDAPEMSGFVDELDRINAEAERSPGFIWRFQTSEGNAVYARPYEDPRIIVNMSVWLSADALKAYVYRSAHVDVYRQRKAWFEDMEGPSFVLWWIPAGTLPTIDTGREKLAHLHHHGSTSDAFTFKSVFPAPSDSPQ